MVPAEVGRRLGTVDPPCPSCSEERDMFVRDLAIHPATASEDEAGHKSNVWEARRHFMIIWGKPWGCRS